MKTCNQCKEEMLEGHSCLPVPLKMKHGDVCWTRGYDSGVSKWGTIVQVDHRFVVIFHHGNEWEQVDCPSDYYCPKEGKWYG